MNYLERVTEELVEHYASMALKPGWLAYARHKVKELQEDPSGNWPDLAVRVKARMTEIENDTR